MDYRQTYETLLKAQCDSYQQILHLLTNISRCDDELFATSSSEIPDIKKVQAITLKKERLIQSLDTLSLDTEAAKSQISDILLLCNEFSSHPLYLRMEQLQDIAREQLQHVLVKEDTNNPSITNNLTEYKEKLETELKIQDIPMEKRQIFFVFPAK